MKQFESDGIVVRKEHRALFVRNFSWEEAKNVYDLRRVLEPCSIELAEYRVDPTVLRMLDSLIHDQESALRRGDHEQLQFLNYKFHVTLAKLSKNELMENMVERLWMMVPLLRAVAWTHSQERPIEVLQEHRIIVDTLTEDPFQAVEAVRTHVNHSWDQVRNALKKVLR